MNGHATSPSAVPRSWRLALLLFLGTAAFHACGTWSLPLMDRDEPMFAEASREMAQRGDWVVPWFNDRPSYDKPPLTYWAQIAAYRMLGEHEFSARLPSVLAAALTAVAIFGFGRRMRDSRTGLWAALIFSTSLQTMVNARAATADPLMILFFTLAAWSGWELGRADARADPGRRLHWRVWFTIALALAFLAKGPVGWLPMLIPILASRWAGHPVPWRRLQSQWTVPLAAGLVGLWGVPALLRTSGDFWAVGVGTHVVRRSFDVLEGHGAPGLIGYVATLPFYAVTVFASFFPWSVRLPKWARETWWRRPELGYDERFLLAGVLLVFGVFTVIRTKLPHYTLPAFPLLSLLLALAWRRAAAPDRAARRAVGAMVAFGLVIGLVAFPLVSPMIPSAELAQRCRPWLRPDMVLAATGYAEPSLCWYFRRTLEGYPRTLETTRLASFMSAPGPRLCILPTADVSGAFASLPPDWKRVRVRGIDVARVRRVDLTALIKE